MVIFHADHKQVILDHCVSSLQNFLFFSLWNEHEPVHQQHVKKAKFQVSGYKLQRNTWIMALCINIEIAIWKSDS